MQGLIRLQPLPPAAATASTTLHAVNNAGLHGHAAGVHDISLPCQSG